jgi:hypothetical protein
MFRFNERLVFLMPFDFRWAWFALSRAHFRELIADSYHLGFDNILYLYYMLETPRLLLTCTNSSFATHVTTSTAHPRNTHKANLPPRHGHAPHSPDVLTAITRPERRAFISTLTAPNTARYRKQYAMHSAGPLLQIVTTAGYRILLLPRGCTQKID